MRTYSLFADIFDYPTPLLGDRVDQLLPLATGAHGARGEAAPLLHQFRAFVVDATPEKVEELYSNTFDLQPLCSPYIGYQIFGEEYRRGMFMAHLREHYRTSGFGTGNDLPDHLCVVLRFLSGREPGEVERELVTDCLVPALEKMVAGLSETTNPYRWALQALLLLVAGSAHSSEEG